MLLTLIYSAVEQPQTFAGKLAILEATEQQWLVQTFTQTAIDYPHQQSLQQMFETQAERSPDCLAVVCDGEQLTYRQLNSQANQLAHYLRRQGVQANVLVGLCLERSVAMIVGLLGILKAGGAYVALDAGSPSARLAYQLADMQAGNAAFV